MSGHDAAIRAMDQLIGPIIGITLVLMSVFIPAAFLPGLTGKMYAQFALVIAATALISAMNAATLTPTQCALFLRVPKPPEKRNILARGFNHVYDGVARWYAGIISAMTHHAIPVSLFALILMIGKAYEHNTPLAVRNFYGALRVKQTIGYPGATIRTLSNGSIQHGTQIFGDLARTPTTYYARDSGVGVAMRNCCESGPRRIGVIGLGAGTIAAYGQPGDTIRFYEINPAVAPIANTLFTYLRDSAAKIEIVPGDARTSLAHEPPQQFNVLVIDAFSGDAIPLHLLTAQAVALYRSHLAPNGVLAFHISNQHVDLGPEIALLAQNAGMQARRVSSPANPDTGAFSSTWILVCADPAFFLKPEVFNNSHAPDQNPKARLWTDDYSSLLPLLRW